MKYFASQKKNVSGDGNLPVQNIEVHEFNEK